MRLDELRDDDGSGAISALSIIVAAFLILTLLLGYTSLARQMRELKLVANVTAIWAAEQWFYGVSPCTELSSEVAEITARNHLQVVSCQIQGDDVQIEVSRPNNLLLKATAVASPTTLPCCSD